MAVVPRALSNIYLDSVLLLYHWRPVTLDYNKELCSGCMHVLAVYVYRHYTTHLLGIM